MIDARAVLSVGGTNYEGWTSVEVKRAFDAAASSFSFNAVDETAAYDKASQWPIKPFDPCIISLAGKKVITGFVDRVESALAASDSSISATGRSKTADAVDCSAIVEGGEFEQVTLDAVARQLAGTVGLNVIAKADVGEPFEEISIDPGSSIFRAIDDLARSRGVLLHDDVDGNLVIDEAQETGPVAELVEGINILSGKSSLSGDKRFSKYVGKGQKRGSDDEWGDLVSEVNDEVQDSGVPRERPLLLAPEEPLTPKALRDRLDWEAATREGEGLTAEVTVLGWTMDNGELWNPGDTVHLSSPKLFVDQALCIRDATFRQNEGEGTITVLSLVMHSALSKQKGGKSGTSKGGKAKGSKKKQHDTWEGYQRAE